ncbi:unnamed protein product [Arabis nemorensis]|uniref:Uncharacterized protein n=1 Tax=Arabis nemorensis TaxID=586526 RepID=A0A565BQF4_9BRAS|nr:unnamed protein product [Arabis nemorensis]
MGRSTPSATHPSMSHGGEMGVVALRLNSKENTNGASQVKDGFTMVRSACRRAKTHRNKVVFSARGSGGGVEKHSRVLTKNTNYEKIETSNSFGSLEEDSMPSDIQENTMETGENKENESIHTQGGKRNVYGKGRQVVSFMEKRNFGIRDGSRGKRNGGSKALESNGPRTKLAHQTQPTRGLVFGPSKEGSEMSSNGNRLRVEKESFGRSGGSFVDHDDGMLDDARIVQGRSETGGDSQMGQGSIVRNGYVEAQSHPPEEDAEMVRLVESPQ